MYFKSLECNKDCSIIYNNLANLYKELDRNEQALEYYHLALKYNENDLDCYNNIGNLFRVYYIYIYNL